MILSSVLLVLSAQCGGFALETAGSALKLSDSGWEGAVGEGFSKNAGSVSVGLGRALGTTANGSNVSHNLYLTKLEGGLMLSGLLAADHWWAGNFEGFTQLTLAGQDHPEGGFFGGLNGGLRYHFRTHTPIDPYITGSVGLSVTDIGGPDLSGRFQFNEQIGAGARYFFTRHYAIGLEYNFWHVSNGGISEPNDGVNAHIVSLGFTWLF